MMVAWVLFGLCAIAAPSFQQGQYKVVDHTFLDKQQKVLTLFKHIHQPSYYQEHVQINHTVTTPVQWLHDNKASFTKPEVVDHAIKFYDYDHWLHVDEIFSVAHHHHVHQAVVLFKLFYYAKDFDTFYKTAVVMREHMNEGLFLYTVSVAIVHRPDTYGVILPPIYEIYPWYFYNSDVVHQAYKFKQMHEGENQSTDQKHHVVANYSGHYLNLHPEQSLSYYLEDVGINAYHYYYHLHYPSWMDGEEFGIKHDHRGVMFLTVYRALVARYYLEKLSHKQGQVPTFDWDVPIETPYYPSLQYPNGLPFPERPKFANLHDVYRTYGEHINDVYAFSHAMVKESEGRIHEAIDSGFVINNKGKKVELYTQEGMDHLGNMITSTPDFAHKKYYGDWVNSASHVLGYSHSPLSYHNVAPSVLEHPETMLRDPAFYQMAKKVMYFVYKYHTTLHPYEKTELVWPGVVIEKVEMDRLITYFDEFYADMSNVVWDSVNELKEDTFHVHVVQQRLNHKPFTYKIHVNSNVDGQATVKVFLGPKYDEYGRYMNVTENMWNFVPLDSFQWHLKSGNNIIKRSSQESQFYSHDKTSYPDLFKKVVAAYQGQHEFHVDGKENSFYFPHRYMLPMGSHDGTPYQFYFFIYPYKPYHGQTEEMTYFYPRPGTGGGFTDDFPVFYPLDRPIHFEKMFVHQVPNSYFYETKVYHRNVVEANVPQPQHHH